MFVLCDLAMSNPHTNVARHNLPYEFYVVHYLPSFANMSLGTWRKVDRAMFAVTSVGPHATVNVSVKQRGRYGIARAGRQA